MQSHGLSAIAALLVLFVPESKSAVVDEACNQFDGQSALTTVSTTATPDLSIVDQSGPDFGCPTYANWNSMTCENSYRQNALPAVGAYGQPGYETTGTRVGVLTTNATAASAMPCNMQQRLVCGGGGGGVIQYHSTGGAVFNALPYDTVQQRALSDLSGTLSLTDVNPLKPNSWNPSLTYHF